MVTGKTERDKIYERRLPDPPVSHQARSPGPGGPRPAGVVDTQVSDHLKVGPEQGSPTGIHSVIYDKKVKPIKPDKPSSIKSEAISGAEFMRRKMLAVLRSQAIRIRKEGGPGSARVLALLDGLAQELLTLSTEPGIHGESATLMEEG